MLLKYFLPSLHLHQVLTSIFYPLCDAVSKVAKANGWDFVFDTNTVGLIYRGGADATAAVKKELGLK